VHFIGVYCLDILGHYIAALIIILLKHLQDTRMSPVAAVVVAETGTKIQLLYISFMLGRSAHRVCYRDASRQKPKRTEPLPRSLDRPTYLPTYNTFTDERTSTTRHARHRCRRGVLLLLLLLHRDAGPRERCSLVRIVFAPLNIGSSGVHSLPSNPTARPSARPRNDMIITLLLS